MSAHGIYHAVLGGPGLGMADNVHNGESWDDSAGLMITYLTPVGKVWKLQDR